MEDPSIVAVLRTHGTRQFWHYTALEDLPSIIETGAILPRAELERRGIPFKSTHYYGDGEKEAKLIALACSKPPKGRVRWTLRLLEHKVVELGIVERASDSTIGRALKKTVSSRIAGSAGSSRRRPTAAS